MKFVPLLLSASLLLGTCFITRVEAQEKSNSEKKNTPAAKTVSKKQLQVWINQLGGGDFRVRRTATNNLLKAGKHALPALVKGLRRKDVELRTRCVAIIIELCRGKEATLVRAVGKALDELEKSSHRSVARLAKNAIQKKLQEDSIHAITKIGGTVKIDKSDPERTVSFWSTKVVDAELVHVKGIVDVEALFLVNTKISDAGLAHLKGMTELRRLHLEHTKITDAGLVHLQGMTSLSMLALRNTKITDAGLQHLQGIRSLNYLWLKNTKVTEAGVKELEAALPKCTITWKSP